jgi:hypothetical protein
MLKYRSLMKALLCVYLGLPSILFADCSAWPRFASTEEYLKPLSVEAVAIGPHLSASEYTQGVELHSEIRGDELWLDVVKYPGTTSAAIAPALIMRVGRLADDNFQSLVLAHEGNGLFKIERGDLRKIGCRFIWGREGGENPIVLMRELYQKLTYYETGAPLSRSFTGSLMGDTGLALNLNNEIVLPAWIFEDVK